VSAASLSIDADCVWASFEREDAGRITPRLLAHGEALTASRTGGGDH